MKAIVIPNPNEIEIREVPMPEVKDGEALLKVKYVGICGADVVLRVAFEHKVLGCNGVYDSFSLGPKVTYDTMPFGFENHLIFASINFRQEHMEKAINVLVDSRYDEVVELIDKEEFISDPLDAYENKIFCKGAPLKTGVIWNKKYIEEGK